MKGIRRSLNKDRIGAPTPTYSSSNKPSTAIPLAQAARPQAAPAPPKRVIRATAAYRARSPQELSFEEGDFFHVVSEEGGEDWFDAANPMTGARGLVPAGHFQVLGRNVRETAMNGAGLAKKSSTGSSGSAASSPYGAPGAVAPTAAAAAGWKAGPPGAVAGGYPPAPSPSPTSLPGGGRPTSTGSSKPSPLYGVVQYDFVAERADELDARKGEPIIVIAQSNHEWFVAKPIGRLGGPGLIPVAFVEIRDMAGKPVDNVEELIRSAVVPKVEEWKKMTADYKSASIPLGRFDFGQQPSAQPSPAPLSPQPEAYDDSYPSAGPSHPPAQDPYASNPENGGEYGDEGYERYSYSRERRQYGLVTSASVESFHQEEGSFWFHLRAFFSTGASLVLYRLYQDFYDFQIALMDEFPVEAGRLPGEDGRTERILPMMPGPTEYEDEVVCAQRVHDLSIYLADLCALPEQIRGSGLMYEFLVPRAGDVEVSPGNGQYSDDASPNPSQGGIENQYGELVDYLDQMDGGAGAGSAAQGRASGDDYAQERDYEQGGVYAQDGQYRQEQQYGDEVADQMGRLSMNGQRAEQQGEQQRYSQRQSAGYGHHQPNYQDAPQPAAERPPMGTANVGVPFIKIKIFHRNTDDLIAIRVPPTVSHAALLDKVRERLGSEVTNLRFRSEVGGNEPAGNAQVVMAGGARLISIEDDEDLERWVRSGARLVLYAD
ncbi:hypothetical protein JCM10213_001173 [Rhodosporidiobolus nylandii]